MASTESKPSARTENLNASLRAVARRVFWWLEPDRALSDPIRFAAQVMTYGNWTDVQSTKAALGEEALRCVLANPPAGVFDARSWVYWHHYFHIAPIPPLPTRHFR